MIDVLDLSKYIINYYNKKNISINKVMISRWENGKSIPDLKQIIAYAKHFNIDINYLLRLIDIRRTLDGKLYKNDSSELLETIFSLEKENRKIIIAMLKELCNENIEILKLYKKIILK